jgi:hypothetical protein
MMAIPGTQLWAKTILAACCKRDTAPDLGNRHAHRRSGPGPGVISDASYPAVSLAVPFDGAPQELWITRIKSRSSRAKVGLRTDPEGGIADAGDSAVSMLATLSPGPAAERTFPAGGSE